MNTSAAIADPRGGLAPFFLAPFPVLSPRDRHRRRGRSQSPRRTVM